MSKFLEVVTYASIGWCIYDALTRLSARVTYANHLKEHEIDVLQAINLHLDILAESGEAKEADLNVPDDMEGLGVE